jgi:hypothetical protein
MKPFIVAIATLSLFVVACGLVPPSLVKPSESINMPEVKKYQPPSASQAHENLTQSEPFTSEYVPGATPSASFEVFVTASELSYDGVKFTSVGLSELSSLTGPFAYVSRKQDQNMTIYTMDVFKNHLVAEYEATRVEALNLFLVQGDKTQAKKNMALWCQAQGPQTREEAQAGANQVICFGFFEAE